MSAASDEGAKSTASTALSPQGVLDWVAPTEVSHVPNPDGRAPPST